LLEPTFGVARQVGELLKHGRWRRYATQKGFANLVSRSKSLICHVEAGRVPVSPDLADQISERTGVDPGWVMDGRPELPIPSATGEPWEVGMIPYFADPSVTRNLASLAGTGRGTAINSSLVADYLSGYVRARIFDELESGGPTPFMTEVIGLLAGGGAPRGGQP